MARRKKLKIGSREDLAWAAGFFDGEGTTSIRSVRTYPYPGMSLNQVNLCTLERFHKAIGGVGKIYGPYQPKVKTGTRQPIYSWQAANFQAAQAAMALLWNFLSEPKRAQYKRAIETARTNPFWLLTYREKQRRRVVERWERVRAAKAAEAALDQQSL
jgi:hypothetical protein